MSHRLFRHSIPCNAGWVWDFPKQVDAAEAKAAE